MEHFFETVIKHKKKIIAAFMIIFFICLLCQQLISVNYDMNKYLPEDSPSTTALGVMNEEFDGGIPNARVMIQDLELAECLEYKEALEQIDGVTAVTWLDDVIDITQPLEMADKTTVETYYKDNTALFTVTIEEDAILPAVEDIRELIGDDNAMTGSAVSTAVATASTVEEIQIIVIFAVLFVLFILILTTSSWVEPLVVLGGLGVAIVINAGTNLIFGEISFVTNAAGNILQLAVSLDYSVFLIHRFEECRQEERNPVIAMKQALVKSVSSILSSGLTTVIGFFALVFMRFGLGPDLGLALAKGVAISLIVVFLFMPGLILMTYKWMDKTKHRSFLPSFNGFGKFIRKVTMPLTIVFTLMIVPSYLASIHNEYYYGSSHIFGEGTQLGDDTALIEDIFGKNDTYALLVPKGETATETKLVADIKEIPQVTSVIAFVEQAGAEIPYEYLDEETLSQLESEHYSRMVLNVETDYEGKETQKLIEQIRSMAEQYYPDEYYLAGQGISTYDLMDTITADMIKVNLVAIGAVFVVLLFTMKSLSLPVILVLTIETAIWINLSVNYYTDSVLFYIAYLIISSIQLGATVDYAILFTERFKENREHMGAKAAIVETVSNVTASILTSGICLTVIGFLMGFISTHGLLSQLGMLLGRGTLCSLFAVFFVLPGYLYVREKYVATAVYRKSPLSYKYFAGKKRGGKNHES